MWCVHCSGTPETAIRRPYYVGNNIPSASNRVCLPTAAMTYCKRKIFTDTLLIKPRNLLRNSYRVIQEERSIFSDLIVWGIVRNNSSYGHIWNCEWLPRWIDFLFLMLGKNCEYTRPIARSHFGCCCPNKEKWRSSQTNNTRSSHTSCKVHSRWRGIFENFFEP
jgi:hypothetical protein